MKPNRAHYHVWRLARPSREGDESRMMYRLARPFHTSQAAGQFMRRWIKRQQSWDEGDVNDQFEVRRCFGERCRPRLD